MTRYPYVPAAVADDIRTAAALDLFADALERLRARARAYVKLYALIPAEEDRRLIQKIRYGEMKHAKILADLSGLLPPESSLREPNVRPAEQPPFSGGLAAELRRLFFQQLDESLLYKNIRLAFSEGRHRDLLLELTVDCQTHAQLLQYLQGKYSAGE